MKARLALPVLLAALVSLLAGCGGSGGGSGGGEPAGVAPPRAPLFARFVVRPQGATKANIERLAREAAGVGDLGGLIVGELEKSAAKEGQAFDYETEVEPWLGEEGGVFAEGLKEGNLHGYGIAVQVEDEAAAWKFAQKQGQAESPPARRGSYEGVEFEVTSGQGQAIGVFDGLLAVAEDEAVLKDMVGASKGESLADSEAFSQATSSLPAESAADLFLDVGALVRQSASGISPQARTFFESIGVEPEEATVVASLIPHSEDVEIDVSAELGGGEEAASGGNASKMLAALPGTSVAAVASGEFGQRLREGIDRLDRQGIPGQVPPHQLKKGLARAGFDLERIAGSIGDAGAFLIGSSRSSIGGALVLETSDPAEARNTISNLSLLLRAAHTPGVSAVGGRFSGFSIRSAELGPQPLVVASAGSRVAVAYGRRAAAAALVESGKPLGESPAYEEAVKALGATPISGFVDGQAALRLVSVLVPPGDEGFQKAKRYLSKVRYVAIGGESSGGRSTAKLIAGIGK